MPFSTASAPNKAPKGAAANSAAPVLLIPAMKSARVLRILLISLPEAVLSKVPLVTAKNFATASKRAHLR
ncbi:MAG: hypothetical protein AAGI92_02450 [Pseudomonadota bacterium]